MSSKKMILAALLLGAPMPLFAQSMPIADAANLFGTRESTQSVSLSPSGNQLLLLSSGPGRSTAIRLVDLKSNAAKTIMSSAGDPEQFRWCEFSSETRIVCRYSGNVELDGVVIGGARLVSFDTNGRDLKQLGQKSSSYDAGLRQYDGSIIDWLPGQDGVVLMQRVYVPEANKLNTRIIRDEQGLGVDRVDTASSQGKSVEPAKKEAVNYLTDGRGNVRIMETTTTASGQLTGRYSSYYRAKDSRDWKALGSYDETDGSGINPLAVDAATDSVYFLRKIDGRDTLYRKKLDGSGAETLIASHKVVDIDNVVRFGNGQRVIGYTYATDVRHAEYFDAEFKSLAAGLSRALPNKPLLDFIGSSADGNKLLIVASSDDWPGSYYLFDRTAKSLNELTLVRPELEGKALAKVSSANVPVSGGATIPAYVTLPPGKEAKGLPIVVLPHGGPSARDEWGFDWMAQFLAARGYAVIQPNYRGSAGFGDGFMGENGFRDWQTAISDIAAAAQYLADQGIGDAKRTAIVGWSYGGYAALQSAATMPGRYKAVVAIAPVTDLTLLKRDARNFVNSKLVSKFVGDGDLAAASPLRAAAKINVPVLLAHGDLDTNVTIAHSDKMAAALSGATYLRYKGLDHQLDDSNARIEILTRMGELLDRTIGH